MIIFPTNMVQPNPKQTRKDFNSNNGLPTWPRFLMISGNDENFPTSQMSPFATAIGLKSDLIIP